MKKKSENRNLFNRSSMGTNTSVYNSSKKDNIKVINIVKKDIIIPNPQEEKKLNSNNQKYNQFQKRDCSIEKSSNNKLYHQNNNKTPNNNTLNLNNKAKIRSESNFDRRCSNYIEKQNKGIFVNGTIGLSNIGNNCYLNSAIQNLKNVHLLTKYLLSNHKNYIPNSFTMKYCELIANLINQDTYKFYEPRNFFSKLNELNPTFRLGQQNDSNFCIIYILNLLEKGTSKDNRKNFCKRDIMFEKNEEKSKFDNFQEKLYKRRNSPIIEYFYGYQEDIYKCANCEYSNYNFQAISVLNLSIMKKDNTIIDNLNYAIEYYQMKQIHYNEQDFFCPKCKKNKIFTQSKIISFPKILIINLKRIGENKFYNHNVDYPITLKVSKYSYELIGYIKHKGGANSGHNIAVCKNFFDDQWYVYNDNFVNPIKNENTEDRWNAYNDNFVNPLKKENTGDPNSFLFFYQKVEERINVMDKEFIINESAKLRK